jgi:glycine betaine/choline ABC-type transport system substrate-binding protein
MSIINQVNALLTTPAIIAMNKAVAVDKAQPDVVAKAFLQANHIV